MTVEHILVIYELMYPEWRQILESTLTEILDLRVRAI